MNIEIHINNNGINLRVYQNSQDYCAQPNKLKTIDFRLKQPKSKVKINTCHDVNFVQRYDFWTIVSVELIILQGLNWKYQL